MEIRQLCIEDVYRELNAIVGVVAVMADGPGSLYIEHKDIQEEIEEFLDGTAWKIVDADGLVGQYPRAYIAPDDQLDCH